MPGRAQDDASLAADDLLQQLALGGAARLVPAGAEVLLQGRVLIWSSWHFVVTEVRQVVVVVHKSSSSGDFFDVNM